ncbi:PepSY domain-containing protein [Novosphingobium sp. BL-52-GroH]|uniref:PepSY domain-containing protein n=1 Tax=Novosphingobium sp. BL-52-GroH TaxID=3349877 RepID=UPI00384FA0E6
MMKPVLFLHRWLGVLVGLLMTIWCLSGFVMMYVDYPRLSPAEQLEGLAPLRMPAALGPVDLPADTSLASARIEMMAGRPVLRVTPALERVRPIAQMRAAPIAFDLATGRPIQTIAPADLQAIARSFGRGRGIEGRAPSLAETPIDQWTVQAYRRNAPLYRADYADPAGTHAYISGQSGEVVQQTTLFERFWGWLGAVPHWLYPTILRQDGELWTQVVIWTSLAGCFLAATGMWVGIGRLRRRRDGTIGSPYRGIWWWHHVFGLFFGVLTLTWLASGLLSMNPWGFLDNSAGLAERSKLTGEMQWSAVRRALLALPRLPGDTVRIETAPLGGAVHLVAIDGAGHATRYAADGRPAPLARAELRAVLTRTLPVARLERLTHEDAYYYARRFPAPLPVWRAQLSDAEHTLLYLDATSGQLIRAFDRNGRGHRWLQDGLHSLDLPVLRRRPLWDIVVLPLLAMVTLVCATGTWMGLSKVRRDVRRLRRRMIRRWRRASSA